jgi:hypothetical protein
MANLAGSITNRLQFGIWWIAHSWRIYMAKSSDKALAPVGSRPLTSAEIRAYLRSERPPDGTRAEAVLVAAADVSAWMRLLPADASREHKLGLAAARLPSVVYWFRRGCSAEDIGRRLTPFGEASYGNRAIDAACALIAQRLNGAPLPREDWPIHLGP